MNITQIPFVIPVYNQPTYLQGMIAQIKQYYPENKIYVLDNWSDYPPLLDFYASHRIPHVKVKLCQDRNMVHNLEMFLNTEGLHGIEEYWQYVVITDPDLLIHPATPPNFLEIFKTAIDVYGFHHAGFGLKTDDIPAWNPKAGWIQGDEKALLTTPVKIFMGEFPIQNGTVYNGWKAPIDTTFCLYKRSNGGWQSPMDGEAWGNSLRLFEVYHLPWYLNKDNLTPEMKNYFATCTRFEPGQVSSGKNNYRPV